MGTEIVFVLIIPIALLCLPTAAWKWSRVAKTPQLLRGGPIAAYIPLIAGFAISMAGLWVLTYLVCYTDFTYLVEEGYYKESDRDLYLPKRVVGQLIVFLVFVLPAMSFWLVPLTVRLLSERRLTLKNIAIYAVIGWVGLSCLHLLVLGLANSSLLSFFTSTALPVMVLVLPIPVATLLSLAPENNS